MDIEQHDYLIIVIITGIIFLQVYVFAGNLRKIRNYRKTIQKANNFDIVEVAVPEDWIKNIEVEEILRNPDAFRTLSNEYNGSPKNGETVSQDLEDDKIQEFEKEVFMETQKGYTYAEEEAFPEITNPEKEQEEEELIVEEYEGFDLEYEDDSTEKAYDWTSKNNKKKI